MSRDENAGMKADIMDTPLRGVLGMKIKFINQRTKRVKTGTVYSISANAVGVAGADNIAYSVKYEMITEILGG